MSCPKQPPLWSSQFPARELYRDSAGCLYTVPTLTDYQSHWVAPHGCGTLIVSTPDPEPPILLLVHPFLRSVTYQILTVPSKECSRLVFSIIWTPRHALFQASSFGSQAVQGFIKWSVDLCYPTAHSLAPSLAPSVPGSHQLLPEVCCPALPCVRAFISSLRLHSPNTHAFSLLQEFTKALPSF